MKNVIHFRLLNLDGSSLETSFFPFCERTKVSESIFKGIYFTRKGNLPDVQLPKRYCVNTKANVFEKSTNLPLNWKISSDLKFIHFYWINSNFLKNKDGKVLVFNNFILIRTVFRWIFYCCVKLILILRRIRTRKKKLLFLCALSTNISHTENILNKLSGIDLVKQKIYFFI
jgi:hypothetical protein